MVFSDGYSLQLAKVTGDVTNGYTATLNVPGVSLGDAQDQEGHGVPRSRWSPMKSRWAPSAKQCGTTRTRASRRRRVKAPPGGPGRPSGSASISTPLGSARSGSGTPTRAESPGGQLTLGGGLSASTGRGPVGPQPGPADQELARRLPAGWPPAGASSNKGAGSGRARPRSHGRPLGQPPQLRSDRLVGHPRLRHPYTCTYPATILPDRRPDNGGPGTDPGGPGHLSADHGFRSKSTPAPEVPDHAAACSPLTRTRRISLRRLSERLTAMDDP
jgi:hypothetical protein